MRISVRHRARIGLAAGWSLALVAIALGGGTLQAAPPDVTVAHYDAANMTDYAAKWSNPYGLGEMAISDTRSITNGAFSVSAVPFQTAYDYSVYDHLKYIGVSNQSFDVPAKGWLEFAVDISASTPGTEKNHVVHGCYGPSGSYVHVGDPCARPYAAKVLEGQQAGVVLNMINFATGQLFDWFVSGSRAFALIERLPSNVTGFGNVGLDKAYTQIINEFNVKAGITHHVAIRYSRNDHASSVEYFLDGKSVAQVDNVGVPLDVQGVHFTGTYPSLGQGEPLYDQIDSFVIGHGLFSLLDAFPFQHPDAPNLSVSIPLSERAFGQGAAGTFSNLTVTTSTK
jgi:hypothetical protein